MKNLKVAAKMIVAFGIVLVMMAVIVIASFWGFRKTAAGLKTFYNDPFSDVQLADALATDLQMAAKNMLYAALASDPDIVNQCI